MKKMLILSGLLICVFISRAQVDNGQRTAALELVKANSIVLGMSLTDINDAIVSGTYQITGTDITMVYLQQSYLGIPVYNQMQVLAFKKGQLVSNAGSRLASMEKLTLGNNEIPSVSAVQAVRSAFAERHIIEKELPVPVSNSADGHVFEFGRLGVATENIKAELIWLPGENKLVRLAWQVQLAPNSTPDLWLIRIDAKTGSYIDKTNLTVTCNWDNKKHSVESHLAESHFRDDFNNFVRRQNDKDWKYRPFIVSDANYTVIKYPAESPQHTGGTPSVGNKPWLLTPGNATSLGWHDDGTTINTNTKGNNVWAQEDWDNNDNTFGNSTISTTPQPTLNFPNVYNFTLAPTEATLNNQKAAITNLFYWNNLLHDISYAYGFDEVSGNFQNSNQGRGGLGADYVIADAQDAGGTNNANFGTPVDGSRPRMQMYLFTSTSPNRDGDLDNGVIAHEYTHGISNRLTGGPANSSCLSNAEEGGEGWSDYFSLMTTTNWATATVNDGPLVRPIGTYVLGQPVTGAGIRNYPYSTNLAVNPLTYSFVQSSGGEVHSIGEAWCVALWEMTWEIIKQDNAINTNLFVPGPVASMIGNSAALKLVVEGMRLQPCSPGFIDARNAILKADTLFFNKKYSCSIWKAFAKRGMGKNASQGSSNSTSDQVVDFTTDASTLVLNTNIISVPETQNIVYTNNVTANGCVPVTNFSLTDTLPANVTYVSGGSYNPANRTVSFNPVTVSPGATQAYTFTVTVNAGSYFPPVSIINETVAGAAIPAFWTETSTTSVHWTVSSSQSHSAPNSFFTADPGGVSDQVLATTNSFSLGAAPPTLSFWHFYSTEPGWDGGVVEISLNGGATWADIGAANFISGGYNGTLTGSGNSLAGRAAFNGNGGGFIKSVINMTPYANQANVKLRFRFGSDESVSAPGWYIDDIEMKNIAVVNMRTSLFDASNNRIAKADTVNSILPANGCVPPTAGTITQPSCAVPTGSVVLSGLPATGTWTINPGSVTGSGTSTTISGLATGIYNFTVTSAGCTSVPSANVVINAPLSVPTVDAVSSQVICNNTASASVNFTSPVAGTVFNWTNNNTSIGLAASGTGNIPSFAAVNTGTSPVNATITVSPASNGVAYITNRNSNTVSVINTSTNLVVATIPVGSNPTGVSLSPDGSRAYVTNNGSGTVSVINTSANAVLATIPVGSFPCGISVSPDGNRLYVVNSNSGNVSVINTATNLVIATIPVGNWPLGASVSPDGSRVYVANSSSNNVSVINTATNSAIATISVGPVPYGTSVNPDGSRVYIANSGSNTVSVINTATNSVVATVSVGANPTGISVNPDGTRVYAANNGAGSNAVSVINTATNLVVATIPVPSPMGLSISADGSQLYVTNQTSNTVSAFNTSTNSLITTIPVGSTPFAFGNFIFGIVCTGVPKTFTMTVNPTATINSIPDQVVCNNTVTAPINFTSPAAGTAFRWTNNTPSIGLAASGTGNIASFTATNITSIPVTATLSVRPSSEGFAYISNFNSNNVSVINTATNLVVATVPVGTAPFGISVSPDGSRVYVSNSSSSNLSVINTATNLVVATVSVGVGPSGVSVSPDGGRVYVSNEGSNTVSVINTATNLIIATIPVGSNPKGITINADGSRVYVANSSASSMSVINTATNLVVATVPVGTAPFGISVSPDGGRVYTANLISNNISVINTVTNLAVATVPVGSGPRGVSVSPDGSRVYVANYASNTVSVINTATNSVAATVFVGSEPFGLFVSPDGSRLYVANSSSNTVSVVNTATNSVVATASAGSRPFALGNFITGGPVCSMGEIKTFTITVNPALTIIITTPTITQPTCEVTTGTIVVNAATATGVSEYSINNGSNWQLNSTFTNLAPGSYNIKVRLQGSNCVATYTGNPVVLNTAACGGKIIPGKIEAEDWDTKSGGMYAVPATDAGGGQQVIGISNGSWMDYNVNVLTTGTYTVNFRVATTQVHAQFQILFGSTILGTINIPNTGGWNNWQTVAVNNISLTAGVKTIRILSTNAETCNFNWMDWILAGGSQPPTAVAGPNQIITLPTNQVTLAGSATANNGGSITSHAWSKFSGGSANITDVNNYGTTVTGLSAGTYVFRLTVTQNDNQTATSDVTITVNAVPLPPTANAGPNQIITLPVNQVTLTGNGTANNGGSITSHVWSKFSGGSATITDVNNYGTTVTGLSAGTYVFRLTVTQNDNQTATSDVTITVNPVSNGKTIPGKIEAENFDTKFGGQYAVPTNDAGGGQQVIGISNGSWMDYNVTVAQTGTYTVNFRIATTQSSAQFQVKLGNTVLGTINIPNTGGWDNWQTVAVNNISLTAGVQTIRILSTNAETCNFNWMDWVLAGGGSNIVVTGTLTPFTTCAGTSSAEQTFTVSGTNLTGNLTITPPAGFELSLTTGIGFVANLPPLIPSGGTINTTTIYVRIVFIATGTPSGNIACASAGATTQNIAASGTVNNLPIINAPNVTQPTCTIPTGTIVVNATGNGTLEYSINNGANWFANATFSGLAPNSYNIKVRLLASPACISTYASNPVVLNAATGCCVAPAIAAPTITQPTCATATGTIVVNATGSGTLEYSTDNGSVWQLNSTFSNLAAGSYNIKVRLQGSTCVASYPNNPIVLNAPACNGKTIPGRIEAESFDAKFGGQYAVTTSDAGGGQQVIGISNGSWMDYNVTVMQTGTYTVNFRIATTQSNAQFQIKLGNTVLGTINIPNTGGWDIWQTVAVNNISLTAGVQTIRILSTNAETCNFNWTDWVFVTPFAAAVTTVNKSPAIVPIVSKVTGPGEIITKDGISVAVFPNPAELYFNLKVQSKRTELITIKVFDMTGRQVQQWQAMPGQTTRFGDKMVNGTYLVEVRQGSERIMTKIVKQ